MDFTKIKEYLGNRESKPIIQKSEYAVLIPLVLVDEEWHILFELRAKNMNTQPGEVSFPGGRMEDGETYEETAVRETMEELNIEKENIEVLGILDFIISSTGKRIVPFLGVLKDLDVEEIDPNKDEVDHIFTVPLDYFLNNSPDKYTLEMEVKDDSDFPYHLIPNGEDYSFDEADREIYFYKYGDYIIWGYTADMMKSCLDILR